MMGAVNMHWEMKLSLTFLMEIDISLLSLSEWEQHLLCEN